MKRVLPQLLLPVSLLLASPSSAETYTFDPDHTVILFRVDHLGFSKTIGRFGEFEGEFTFSGKPAADANVKLTIEASSVDTFVPRRDQHLRSPDFFSVEEFPKISFQSTKIEPTGDATAKVTGDLTLHGVTKPVVIEMQVNRVGKNPRGVDVAGFSGATTLKRSDFGMMYGQGGIGDQIEIWLEVEGMKK